MSDLIAFLRARRDEDEAAACAVNGEGRWRWVIGGDPTLCDEECRDHLGDLYVGFDVDGVSGVDLFLLDAHGLDDGPAAVEHIARWSPARVLADVAAKRRIIDCLDRLPIPDIDDEHAQGGESALVWVCRVLAQEDADHPDFDPAWRLD